MKRIQDIEAKKRRQKRNQTLIGVILIVLMVFSTAGYAFYRGEKSEKEKETEYNGHIFYLNNNLWQTEMQGVDFAFEYPPNETLDIETPFVSLGDYNGRAVYFISEDDKAKREILANIGRYFERFQDACFEECEEDLPVKNCTDNMILIKIEDKTKVYKEDNCVFIEGNKTEIIRASDAFIYKVLGIR